MLNKNQIKDFMAAMKENGDTDPMQVSLENMTVFADTQEVELSEVIEFCQVAKEMGFMELFSDESEDSENQEDNFSEDENEENEEEFSDTPKVGKPEDETPPADKPEDKPAEMSEEDKTKTKEELTALKDKLAKTGDFSEGENLKEFIQCCGQVAELGKKIAKPEEFAKTVFDKKVETPKDEPKEDKPKDEKPAEDKPAEEPKDEAKKGKPANFSEGGEPAKPTFDYLDKYL